MSASPLPLRDGVGASSVWLPPGPWRTVLEFLQQRFADVEAASWRARMERGEVVDAAGAALSAQTAYRDGVRLYYYRESAPETRIPFDATILYRDGHLLAVDKPHFLPVVPAGRFLQETLLVRLRRQLRLDFLTPLHRIDRETAGVVLFSIEPKTRASYHALFQRHEIVKTYEALAPTLTGVAFPIVHRSRLLAGQPFFRMQESAGIPNSETRVELLEIRGDISLYRLTPLTGRKHQLRVHMAALGAPIENDAFYPTLTPDRGDDFSKPLQLLAKTIDFIDPLSGAPRRFESSRALADPT